MSWNVELYDPATSNIVSVPPHKEGDIIDALGGTPMANMSVTWNYRPFYYESLDPTEGFRWLNGKTAADTVTRLENAIAKLGTLCHSNYWAATPGNAGHTIAVLLGWAKQHPTAMWKVT